MISPPKVTLPSFGGASPPEITTMTSTSDVAGSSASDGRQITDPLKYAPANPGIRSAYSPTHRPATAQASRTLTGDPHHPLVTTTGAAAAQYGADLAPPARRALASGLPEVVAAAPWELIAGAIAREPWRVGKPLLEPYEGLHVARRGTYRVVYRIDEDTFTVTIEAIKHRRDAYRS